MSSVVVNFLLQVSMWCLSSLWFLPPPLPPPPPPLLLLPLPIFFAILWMLEVFSGSGGRVKRGEEPLFCERDLSGQFLNAQVKPWALKPNKVYFLFLGKIISKNIYDL